VTCKTRRREGRCQKRRLKTNGPVLREQDLGRSDAGRCPIVHPTPTLPR
jgi:hypothetical protein